MIFDLHVHNGETASLLLISRGWRFGFIDKLFAYQAEQICFQNDIGSCDRDDNIDGQPNTPQTYIAHRFLAQIAEGQDLLEPEHDRSDKKSGEGVDP